ncbi:MATE family efflux transporter [Brachyspira hyodysenteriae]|uniref:MATE family efflux transporter n=1 Tax=Brachyspira hyodysenteriae TaxID=159 RepID=UPI001183D4EA|nr:MATE family efflux transporter [Brachyspira hyodysenteriae]TVL67258.1 MATE family efflux transporter [Brachyspira hyodysenteriae]TVL78181.1 MATE family efflux transporter [Brachyspira hyodysenteriae]
MYLIKFSFILFVSNILQYLYSIIDIIFISHIVGDYGVVALGNSASIMFIITSVSLGLSIGGSIIISKYKGANDTIKYHQSISTLLFLSALFSIIISVLGIIFSKHILIFMNVPKESFNYAYDYIRIIFSGVFFIFLYGSISSIIKSSGKEKVSLYFIIVASITNILLDFLFVYVLELSVKGASFATVISQALSFLLSLYFIRKDIIFNIDINIIKELIYVSFPCIFQMLIINISFFIINIMMNKYDVITGFTIGLKINTFIGMISWSIGEALSILVSKSIGERDYIKIKKSVIFAVFFNITVTMLSVVFIHIFAKNIIAIFYNGDDKTINDIIFYLRVCASFNGMTYALMYILDSFLIGIQKSYLAFINSFIDSIIFKVILSMILEISIGFIGIYISIAVSSVAPSFIGIIYFLMFINKYKLNKY